MASLPLASDSSGDQWYQCLSEKPRSSQTTQCPPCQHSAWCCLCDQLIADSDTQPSFSEVRAGKFLNESSLLSVFQNKSESCKIRKNRRLSRGRASYSSCYCMMDLQLPQLIDISSPTPVSLCGRTLHCITKQNDGERETTDPDGRGNEGGAWGWVWEREQGWGMTLLMLTVVSSSSTAEQACCAHTHMHTPASLSLNKAPQQKEQKSKGVSPLC